MESTLKLIKQRRTTATRRALFDKGADLSLMDIVSAPEVGDDLLSERLGLLRTHLGMLAGNLANLFSPEKIVLAGEVCNCSQIVRQQMERTFRQYTIPPILATTYLVDSTLGVFAGALGAAWLGFEKLFPVDEGILMEQAKQKQQARSAG